MLRIIIIFFVIFSSFGQTKYQKDFDTYWTTVDQYFGYFDTQCINWEEVRRIYQPSVDAISNDDDFIRLLEEVNKELYNGHVSLNVNLPTSNKLIPSGSDISVSYTNHKFIITGIREGSKADQLGLAIGMTINKYNNMDIDIAVHQLLPKSANELTDDMYTYMANYLIAGTYDVKRILYVNESLTFDLGTTKQNNSPDLIEGDILEGNIGYIKINNSLGNNQTIQLFDQIVDTMLDTKGIIIDLRETPNGGNTTVARAIMGRFIDKEVPYQKHVFKYEEIQYGVRRSTLEFVSPRGIHYDKPLVVLCGSWTGSMGEGITIGLDGMNRAEVVGNKMAGLLGAIYNFTLSETGIEFQIPTEKLFHINGEPREDFIPKHFILDTKEQLSKAIEIIQNKKI